ncbi:MAG TPA: alpha/beta hydrolase [Acidimicrobiales bacterium]|nr:alpha/beta hydrolase [Acidimicrobiales bacterium]
MITPMQERRIRLETGVEVAALEAVGGSRGLLCVHGWPAAKEDFADHLSELASAGGGWHAVALDQRGHGRSDAPAGPDRYSLETFADDVLALADALGWSSFVLLGHSMGGMVSQVVALRAPERLDGLILMDTSHGPVGGIDPDLVALGKSVVAEGGMAALIEAQRSVEGALDTPAHQRVLASRPGYAEFGESKTLAASPDMWLGVVDEVVTDQADRLAALSASTALTAVPTLLIYGEQDAPFVPHAHRLAEALPHARLQLVPDAGHSPQFENPTVYLRLVRGFLADVTAVGRRESGQTRS